MCTEMLVGGNEITRDGACWCELHYTDGAGKDALADLGAHVNAALVKECTRLSGLPHDESKRDISVTVTVRRW